MKRKIVERSEPKSLQHTPERIEAQAPVPVAPAKRQPHEFPTGERRQRETFLDALLHKLASFCLLFAALGVVFVIILGLLSWQQPEVVSYLATGSPQLSFLTIAEQNHMADVHTLIGRGVLFSLICAVLVCLYGQYRCIEESLARDAFIMACVLVFLLIPFNYTFTWFHQAFFPVGNYEFPADSWLITHFSETFFATVAAAWVGATAVVLWLLRYGLRGAAPPVPKAQRIADAD